MISIASIIVARRPHPLARIASFGIVLIDPATFADITAVSL
jgi:hypothetical protein